MSESTLEQLERLGRERAVVNAKRAALLAELRAAVRRAHREGLSGPAIASAAGITREAVRLAVRD